MTNVYCKAPWVSISYMPGGKFAPCCQWNGKYFDSIEEMTQQVGGKFLENQVPVECNRTCPAGSAGWRSNFEDYETDFKQHSIQFLDFRNNNLCNLKCRSCGPQFSTSWASESDQNAVHFFQPANFDNINLKNCKKIYFAGGEPLLNPQHYELLNTLVKQSHFPHLMYSTNTTVLNYKDQSVKELWPMFANVSVYASIDAVGPLAEVVRSGSNWSDIEKNLQWMRQQPNINLSISTVVSAINIWWIQDLFDYLDWLPAEKFEGILAYLGSTVGVDCIPRVYKEMLLETFIKSRFCNTPSVYRIIEALNQPELPRENWYRFLSQQMILDHKRNESWYALLPPKIKNMMYEEIVHGKTINFE